MLSTPPHSLRIGINRPIDHHDKLSHLTVGELPGQAVEKGGLRNDLNEVRFQKLCHLIYLTEDTTFTESRLDTNLQLYT